MKFALGIVAWATSVVFGCSTLFGTDQRALSAELFPEVLYDRSAFSGIISISPNGDYVLGIESESQTKRRFIRYVGTPEQKAYLPNSATFVGWSESDNNLLVRVKGRLHQINPERPTELGPDISPPLGNRWRLIKSPDSTNKSFVFAVHGRSGALDAQVCVLNRGLDYRCRLELESPSGLRAWLMNSERTPVFRALNTSDGGLRWEKLQANGGWLHVFDTEITDRFLPVGAVDESGSIWAISDRGRDQSALVKLDTDSGQETVVYVHRKRLA